MAVDSHRSVRSPVRLPVRAGMALRSSGWTRRHAMRADKRSQANGGGVAPGAGVRCGIYTRKSTEEGLEQAFNTLDAQREAAESFISSQRQEGWTALPQKYDDGGYTGANMDRPALKRLL